jgi:hypothetical protein
MLYLERPMIFVDLQYMDNTVPDVILFYFILNVLVLVQVMPGYASMPPLDRNVL